MPIRKPKPTSPGRRFVTYADFGELTKKAPEKSLTEGLKKSGGRNVNGRKTARHRGGGAKRLYRIVDFKRRKDGVPARVAAIEYDPNRSSYIALLHYVDGAKAYILAPNRLRVGMIVESGPQADITVGNALPLANMPVGTVVHNVELQPGRGGQLARSAGSGVQLMAKEGDYATLRLPSGEMRMVRTECRATVGTIGNADHQNITAGLRPHAHVALAAGLAHGDVLVVGVADRADGRAALGADHAHLAGRQAQGRVVALLRHQLHAGAGRARELAAAPRLELDVVDHGADRHVRQRQRVADRDVGVRAGLDDHAGAQPVRREDVGLRAVGVVQQRDVGRPVRVVLDRGH